MYRHKSRPPIITKNNKIQVPNLEFKQSHFIDRTTCIIGPSGTGKTTVAKQIMYGLKDSIDQIVVVNSTENGNKAYTGTVDPLFIHFRPWLPESNKINVGARGGGRGDDEKKGIYRFLDTLWKRQEMLVEIYRRANKIKSLDKLYSRLHRDDKIEGDKFIEIINRKRNRTINGIKSDSKISAGEREQKIREIDEKFESILIATYKKFIIPNIQYLYEEYGRFSEDEKYAFQYIDLNPRILVIFDDCSAELKTFFNRDVFRKMFYQNRHAKITFIIICQDDTDLTPNLKKNVFQAIYTSDVASTSNFERKSSGLPKAMQKDIVEQIIPAIFKDDNKKLVFYRTDPKKQLFYYWQTDIPPPFKFGSQALNDLCESIRIKDSSLNEDNPFYDRLKVK
jgi:hypothetical protein